MTIPHPFPYQGSKRKLAKKIIAYIPSKANRLVEPFAGSGSVSIAAIYSGCVQSVLINDLNKPLIELWQYILDSPEKLADNYAHFWQQQQGREREYYSIIRDQFNHTAKPEYLLFLLARCVKASVRYNAQGHFNQSPDNRRSGMKPETMRKQLLQTSKLMSGRVQVTAEDYRVVLENLSPNDVVYMDPPYQGVVGSKDPRYYGDVSYDDFVKALDDLNSRNIPYIVSYDGRTGSKIHGNLLPDTLNLDRLEIDAGVSSQATLLGKTAKTYESLYLSRHLVNNAHYILKEPSYI